MKVFSNDGSRQISENDIIFSKAGIWQGRFQPIHNGHKYVFDNVLGKFDEQFVAIVNPNPMALIEFNRFDPELNPFNYFERMLLWKTICISENRDVYIVPCWHARKSVELETEFLPLHSQNVIGRCWIVPMGAGENEVSKKNDLCRAGEMVFDFDFYTEPDNCQLMHATRVRDAYENCNENIIQALVPTCIQDLTRDLFNRKDPYEYKIIPLIKDAIDFVSLEQGIQWQMSKPENRYIVITITVGVKANEKEWWFCRAEREGSFYNFYSKMKKLHALFKELGFSKFIITPIFVRNGYLAPLYDYSLAFLPPTQNATWIINDKIDYAYGLKACLNANGANVCMCSEELLSDRLFSIVRDSQEIKQIEMSSKDIILRAIDDLKISFAEKITLAKINGGITNEKFVQEHSSKSKELEELKLKFLYNVNNSDFVLAEIQKFKKILQQ